ncbi:MAG: VacJ family lipoprotein [Pseudomonadales bacterium]|nr:VacJ family lipoprotein [Pseudomonadales bacterium]MBO6657384.1 VacJ family lipoprotein [Pseudomonadales bacterium]MBO6702182.1 VacJ family lipoprotein [Pseudomonadales bacterium]MBO7006727.1 VacJ family lipoprotein [Pseudomonadales bacterium]
MIRGLCLLIAFQLFSVSCFANEDPYEGVNRKIQNFNDFADAKLIRPIAVGYDKVMPNPGKRLVSNFFGNLVEVGNGLNNLLQGKPKQAGNDVSRVLINTTIGIGGLFDPATRMGLRASDEDFGQTLAVWGVPRGPYIVLPFLGPTTVRDVFSRSVDSRLDPLRYYYPVNHRNSLFGFSVLHTRSQLLAADSVVFGDRYIFFRDAYLQRREFQEKDGEIEDPFDDEF